MAARDTLSTYRRRRNPRKSPEPAGTRPKRSRGKPRFVIQEHQATSHHYDFRLEVAGVLKSWAVPKGPSTDPRDKRLAMMVEDHPLDYADFEGIIPEGEYGAGTVIVWDRGTYRNLREEKEEGKSMAGSLKEGKVEVWLEGEKLQGGYVLIRTGGDNKWLLKKMKDEKADARRNPVTTQRESVKSGRTLEELQKEQA
jgi:DNA ligase D-like protein (predicted 3'-phosphoesterase)